MTRETKAGLVVCSSFLCLVGIVLFSKLNETEDTGGAEVATTETPEDPIPQPLPETPNVQSNAAQPGAKSGAGTSAEELQRALYEKKANNQNSTEQQAQKSRKDGAPQAPGTLAQLQTTTLGDKNSGPVAPPASLNSTNNGAAIEDGMAELDNIKYGQNGTSGVRAPANTLGGGSPPLPAKTDPRFLQSIQRMPDAIKREFTSLAGLGLRRPGANSTPPRPTQDSLTAGGVKKHEPLLPMPGPPPAAAADTPAALTSGARGNGVTGSQIGTGIGQSPRPALTLNSGAGAGTTSVLPPASLDGPTKLNGAAQPTGTNAPEMRIGTGSAATAAEISLTRNGPGANTVPGMTPNRPALGAPSVNNSAEETARVNARLGQPALPTSAESGASRVPAPTNETAAGRALPPLGAAIPTVRTPIAVPTAPAGDSPQVESYDEDTYTCRTNDTFRTISQSYYQSERYERALLLFNRNHPLAIDNIRQEPPVLRPNQAVYIPPARILEKYYASAISETSTGAAVTETLTPSRESTGQLRPLASSPIDVARGSGTIKPAAPERTYRVGGTGEMYREIARRTLGDSDRWPEIYKLNRTYDPSSPVPAGSELRLPSDARADAR